MLRMVNNHLVQSGKWSVSMFQPIPPSPADSHQALLCILLTYSLKITIKIFKKIVKFLNLYDKLLNTFKRNKTASITNQMNNIFGNTTNLYLSGMSVPDIAKYSTKSLDDLTKYEKILPDYTPYLNRFKKDC